MPRIGLISLTCLISINGNKMKCFGGKENWSKPSQHEFEGLDCLITKHLHTKSKKSHIIIFTSMLKDKIVFSLILF